MSFTVFLLANESAKLECQRIGRRGMSLQLSKELLMQRKQRLSRKCAHGNDPTISLQALEESLPAYYWGNQIRDWSVIRRFLIFRGPANMLRSNTARGTHFGLRAH